MPLPIIFKLFYSTSRIFTTSSKGFSNSCLIFWSFLYQFPQLEGWFRPCSTTLASLTTFTCTNFTIDSTGIQWKTSSRILTEYKPKSGVHSITRLCSNGSKLTKILSKIPRTTKMLITPTISPMPITQTSDLREFGPIAKTFSLWLCP